MIEEARRLAVERRWPELAALTWSASESDSDARPELAFLIADALRRIGEVDRARDLADAAADGAVLAGSVRLRLRVGNLRGMLLFDAGELTYAEDAFERLLQLASDDGDDEFAARASNNLGVIASVRGNRELALTAYQRAIAAYQRLGHTRGLAQTHYNTAIVYRDLGFAHDMERNLAMALRYATEGADEDVTALVETERALLLAASGDGPFAEKLAERALERMQRLGDPLGAANAVRALASAASARNRPVVALSRLEEALDAVERYPDLLLRAEIQRDRAVLLLEAGDRQNAHAALVDSLDSFQKLGAEREAEATSVLLSRLS